MNISDQIQSVVFDIDGTLLDTLPSLTSAANDVLLQAGWSSVAPESLRPVLSEGLGALFHRALSLQPNAVPDAVAQRLEVVFWDRYSHEWLRKATVFEGVREVLVLLREKGLTVGICTNRDRASTTALLDSTDLSGFFDTIVGMGDATCAKPGAAPLQLAMQRLGAIPSATLFVGDSGIDAACAHAAEVRFAAHLCGYARTAADLRPNVMDFSVYSELGDWITARTAAPLEAARHG